MEFMIEEGNDRKRLCPVCAFQTMPGKENSFWICEVCDWEDDGVEEAYPDQNMGGANGEALNDYRARWLKEHHRDGV